MLDDDLFTLTAGEGSDDEENTGFRKSLVASL
jgi:hypothetical protein